MSYDAEIEKLRQNIKNKNEELLLWTVADDGSSDRLPTPELERIVNIYKKSINEDQSKLENLLSANAKEELNPNQKESSPSI